MGAVRGRWCGATLLAYAWIATMLAGCSGGSGDDAANGMKDKGAGAGGAVAAHAGAGGSATGGAAAGAGAGTDDAGVRAASIDDVDLTLDGFNQDLPPPSVDCLTKTELLVGCMAISGSYNGEPFQLACEERTVTVANSSTAPHIGCRGPVVGGDLVVELGLDPELATTTPTAFSADAPTPRTYATVWHLERDFQSYPIESASASNLEQTLRVAYLSTIVEKPSRTEWRIEGSFGLTLTAMTFCEPDAMGRPCDEVRLRGNFRAIPLLL